MYLRELDELEEAIQRAISARLKIDVRQVRLNRGVNEDGDQTIFVNVVFAANPDRLKRGFMFDLVGAAAGALREAGEYTPAVIMARPQKAGMSKEH